MVCGMCAHCYLLTSLTLLLTLCGLTSRKTHRGGQGSADQSMKKPILVSLVLFNHPLKALMLEASTTLWSSGFHLLITLFEKNTYSSPVCTET